LNRRNEYRRSIAKPRSYHLALKNCRDDPHIETGHKTSRKHLTLGECVGKKKPPDSSRGGRKGYFHGLRPVIFIFRPNPLMSRVAHTFLMPKRVDMVWIWKVLGSLISVEAEQLLIIWLPLYSRFYFN
jgi:hypothetical protein